MITIYKNLLDGREFSLHIERDEWAKSPRDWDNLTKMVCFNRNYKLGDNGHGYDFRYLDSWDDLENTLRSNENVVSLEPLYLYDHSGISISTSRQCTWDSSMVGFIYVTKDELVANNFKWSGKDKVPLDNPYIDDNGEVTDEGFEAAKSWIDSELKTYDQYLTGDVYRYVIRDEDDECIDSCSGYFGDDSIEEIKKEFYSLIDHYNKQQDVLDNLEAKRISDYYKSLFN